jgi:hypothetical protein
MTDEPMVVEQSGILAAELRWATRPAIDVTALLPRIEELARTRVEHVPHDDDSALDQLVFPELRTAFDEGSISMQVVVMRPDPALTGPLPPDAYLHSWDWPEAEAVLSGAADALLVTDLMARGVPRGDRLRAWHAVVRAIVEAGEPLGMHLTSSDHVVSPAWYLRAMDQDPSGLAAVLNVRRFHVRDGETVMDTLGLAPLGLPDVQLHFTDLGHEDAAEWVASTAWYLFERGDVIADGHTVTALDRTERWPCVHEIGMADPERVVIDVNPWPHGPERRADGTPVSAIGE